MANIILTRKRKLEQGLTVSLVKMDLNKIVIVVGTTGTGKSTIINMLYNNDFNEKACSEPCSVGISAATVTKQPEWHYNRRDKKVYGDTVGLSDPDRTDEEIAKELKQFIQAFKLGVHCIIIVAKYGRFSREERCNLKIISEILESPWVGSSIMVLTHCTKKFNENSMQDVIQDWLGNDQEIIEFVKKIEGRVLLTDNSLEMYEEQSRPIREQCLKKLNEFVDRSDILIRPIQNNSKDQLKSVRAVLEQYLASYYIGNPYRRAKKIVKFFKSEIVKAGTCSICHETMQLNKMAQTECNHIFHKDCIIRWVNMGKKGCPYCRSNVKTIIMADPNPRVTKFAKSS